ncbi:2-oxoglutarate ferredoxin oxidoreductase subunit alpha [Methanomicrobium sp. W14]|uniref:2-oxoacid:acceptor oxidoreductase subunit alpha n=1 Tax=Methanomicrobium sp. W14 TaxID=2817839 RepID=UPI001AE3642E|nr:2-oxoacid:acceptor oxidoreductase subunit alpha [Methanomicrobium sp. W14]MBP2133274.1 2-oxoglutarate ferredoxin oxidoreductase subunit alpha [Methanomicrobium sp. W14]
MSPQNNEIEVLIGGKAGEGINRAGQTIAEILSGLGYYIYMIFDHPSLIKGGHNFSVIRASPENSGGISTKTDIILAMDKNTIESRKDRISGDTVVIFNSDKIKNAEGIGVPADTAAKEAGGIPIMANSCIIGAFCRSIGLDWDYVRQVLEKEFPVKTSVNIEIAKKGYDLSEEKKTVLKLKNDTVRKVVSGSEAVGLGLCFGGLDGYIAYPMSPASGILHFLSSKKDDFGIKVFQPEGEIAAVLMAEGMACCGSRAATGTSGGGFCLMNEGLSYSGIAEVPIVIINSQRQSPATGSPTYTAQSDLFYVIHAGHGEFPRIVLSPGNAEQAFIWSAKAVGLAWEYQIPVIILTDVTLNDSLYTLCPENVEGENYEYGIKRADGKEPYKRYLLTDDGISPYAVFTEADAPVKFNGKAHDEYGISTDRPEPLEKLAEKRLKKASTVQKGLLKEKCVAEAGNAGSDTVVISWGSNAPLCSRVCGDLGLKSVQPVVLYPFPKEQFKKALSGAKKVIVVEDNPTGQLADLMAQNGFYADKRILSYTGRQMTTDTLKEKLAEVL